MAPFTLHGVLPEDSFSRREKTRVRKPIVEKMRRDRINNSIEQLRTLLQRHLKQQLPGSKLEKADVLEMVVSFLRQRVKSGADLSHRQRFSQCLDEARLYPSHRSDLQSPEPHAYEHFQAKPLQGGTSAEKHQKPASVSAKQPVPMTQETLWRPW